VKEPTSTKTQNHLTGRAFEKPEAAELDLNAQNLASSTAGKIRGPAWISWRLSIAALAALVCISVVVAIATVSLRRAQTTTAKFREWTSTQITTNDSDNPVNTAAISPNGRWLAYQRQHRHLRARDTDRTNPGC
jgi:hypothetical protein